MVSAPAERQSTGLRTLLTLAWPIIISRSTQVVVGASDAFMVAGLGEAALAATTTGALNTFILLILPMGIVFIVGSFVSQLFGAGDVNGARRFGVYGLWVALATQGVAFGAIAGVPWVLSHSIYEPAVSQLMSDYLQMRLLSAGAAIGMEVFGNYYGGLGNTRRPMLANVTLMVLNVIGNYVLISGRWGAPAMGVTGSALASTLATYTAFFGLWAMFLWEGRRLEKSTHSLREFRRMLRFGIPSGFNWFFEYMAFNFYVNVVVAGLGTTALAALMSVLQINSVSFMPAFGLCSAGAILVGQAIGSGQKDDVPKTVRLTFITAASYQCAVGLLYIAIPGWLFAPFVREGVSTPELMVLGTRMLALSAAWQLFDATVNALAESLRAAGDTAWVLWARTLTAWGIFAPGAYFSVHHFGGTEVSAILWLVLYLALLAGALALRFRSGAWRRITLVEPSVV